MIFISNIIYLSLFLFSGSIYMDLSNYNTVNQWLFTPEECKQWLKIHGPRLMVELENNKNILALVARNSFKESIFHGPEANTSYIFRLAGPRE